MTGQLIQLPMKGQGYITMLTMRHPSTLSALYQGGKATTVLEENRLLSSLQSLSYLRQQQWRERSCHHLPMLQVSNIHHLYLWQFDILITRIQFHQPVFARLGIMIALQRWRCRTKHRICPEHLCQHNRHTTSMIARSWILLFIGCLMLFVHNNQP